MSRAKIPIGYKQTEIGVIPEDWDVDSIGNLSSITTGDKNTQDRVNDGEYPFFVRSSNIERINSYTFDGEAVLTAGDGLGTGKIFHYINLEKPEIAFDTLWPEFARKYDNRHRFANVIKIGGWGDNDQIATTFPCNYRNPSFPKFRLGWEYLLPTAEGLVFFPEYKNTGIGRLYSTIVFEYATI